MIKPSIELNHRERATLLAIALGRAEISCSCEPDLFIDGLAHCDQSVAHRLARQGLVAAAHSGKPGDRFPAILTHRGRAALEDGSDNTATGAH